MTRHLIYLKKLPVMDGLDWWYDANDDPEQEEPPGAAASPTSPARPTASPMATAAAEGSVGMTPIRRAQPDASFRSVGVPGTLSCRRSSR